MKQTDSDKMDLLLRSLVRREGGRPVSPGSTIEDHSLTDHLDADELSSYSERALPDATRARYTAHLADCSRCRKIVTELTLASGASLAGSRLEKLPSQTLWEKFSAFFSPPVLRYAVPALALSAVIAVTLVALKQGQQADLVAQNQQSPSLSVAENKSMSSEVAPAADKSAAPTLKKEPDEPRTIAGANENKRTKATGQEEVSQIGVAANSVSVAAAKDASTTRATESAAQPSFAPEPAPAAPPKEQSKTVDARRVDEVGKQKEQMAEREAAAGSRDDNQARANDKAEPTVASPQSQDAMIARRRVKGLTTAGEARRAEGAGAKKGDSNEEVREVAGRRFRRQGQTWVDTAYDASRSAIGVARGSEQYRALIADEPGIRIVAEQLPGEVILVWKGRTYRIR